MYRYVAVIEKEPESDFGVYFPDLPGCISAGSTLEQAREMAVEALEMYLEDLIEDGEALPEPTSKSSIEANPESDCVVEVTWVEAKSALLETA